MWLPTRLCFVAVGIVCFSNLFDGSQAQQAGQPEAQAGQPGGQQATQNEPERTEEFPIADVVLQPARRWKTTRQEVLRLRQMLKKFIKREIDAVDAEMKARQNAKAHPQSITLMQMRELMQSSNPFAGAQGAPKGGRMVFPNSPTISPNGSRFMQRSNFPLDSALAPGIPGMTPQFAVPPQIDYNEAGALLDAMQPEPAAAIAKAVTEVGLNPTGEKTNAAITLLQTLKEALGMTDETTTTTTTTATTATEAKSFVRRIQDQDEHPESEHAQNGALASLFTA